MHYLQPFPWQLDNGHPPGLWNWAQAGSEGSDPLCHFRVLSYSAPGPPNPVSQTVILLPGCKNNCLTCKHTFSLFLWSLVPPTNGWKLLVGSNAQLSVRDNEKKMRFGACWGAQMWLQLPLGHLAYEDVSLARLLDLCSVMGTSLQVGSCASGLAVKFWNWPRWWERRGLLSSAFSNKMMLKLAQAQSLKVKPSRRGEVLRNALE